jgi:hypothetical protein
MYCGFDEPRMISIEVAFTISGVVLARHLCPALQITAICTFEMHKTI